MVRNEPPVAGGVQAQVASTKKERSSANPQVSEGPGGRAISLARQGADVWATLHGQHCPPGLQLPYGRFTNTAGFISSSTPDKVGVTIPTYSQKKRGSERWLLAPEWLVSPLTKSGFQSGPFDSRDPAPRGT